MRESKALWRWVRMDCGKWEAAAEEGGRFWVGDGLFAREEFSEIGPRIPTPDEDIVTMSRSSYETMLAKGAREVASAAWTRKDWLNLGGTPQEIAANHATLVANELRRNPEQG